MDAEVKHFDAVVFEVLFEADALARICARFEIDVDADFANIRTIGACGIVDGIGGGFLRRFGVVGGFWGGLSGAAIGGSAVGCVGGLGGGLGVADGDFVGGGAKALVALFARDAVVILVAGEGVVGGATSEACCPKEGDRKDKTDTFHGKVSFRSDVRDVSRWLQAFLDTHSVCLTWGMTSALRHKAAM